MITVVSAPPYATVQDLGRDGHRSSGIPPSGVADRDAALTLNALLQNEPNAAMLEWAVAGGTLRFDSAVTVALGGADVDASIGGVPVRPYSTVHVRPSEEMRVERLLHGRFLYIAVRGGIDVPVLLGSRSTLVSAGLGGHEGRRLRRGDVLRIGQQLRDESPDSTNTGSAIHESLHDRGAIVIPVIRGPQAGLFDDRAWDIFLGTRYTVSHASDRAGYRLDGPILSHSGDAALPSEPTCVGAIQVPDGGTPIVLMNDGPTVGGYPKIAVIRSSAISSFAQRAPGETVRFVLEEWR